MPSFIYQGYFVLFVIISLGMIIGDIKIKGFSLDSSAVIFVALLLGHLGFSVPGEFQTLGLLIFIFTIGIQAGPGFFDAFLKYGRRLIMLALILILSAALMVIAAMYIFDIPSPLAIGMLNGSLTSTPGLAAAYDATQSPLTAVGYGIAYPVGVVGVILFMQVFPRIMRIDFIKEEQKYDAQLRDEHPGIRSIILKVTNANIGGKSLKELDVRSMTQGVISRIKHQGEIFTPTADTKLFVGDIIKGVGNEDALFRLQLLLGEPIDEDLSFDERYVVNWLLVTSKSIVNKSLREINLSALNATVTRIRRSGIDLPPKPHSKLRFGDKLLISGSSHEMNQVRRLLGNDEKRLSETNFLPISLGIVIGVLVGSVSIPVFGLFNFSLGLTGGVLATALILSNIGKTGNILWSMSGSANQLLRRFGMLLFMATVGTNAGSELAGVLQADGVRLLSIGLALTFVPMIIAALVGWYLLKMNFITLLGVLAGSMTSTPGLAAIDSKTNSEAASLGYATVYPAALVLMILVSQLLALF
jgi:putative transport protein